MMNSLAMVNGFEIVIIILVVVLLFGSAKIPQLMRGLGSGISEFKKGLKEGETAPADAAKPGAPPATPAAPADPKPPEAPPQAK
jgi:sec-independent protein translocase protein TatA